MIATWIAACLFFCVVLTGCSSIPQQSLSDLCSIKFGTCGALSLDVGECDTCAVDPTEEKIKELHNLGLKSHDDDQMAGSIGLKATWKF